jgi:glucose/arabinose dehydrogenase
MRKVDDPVRAYSSVQRRRILQSAIAGVGGLAAGGLLPGMSAEAKASPSDPNAGPLVTPDPIGPTIQTSGLRVRLVDFMPPSAVEAMRTASAKPYARLNYLHHAGDGSSFIYTNDTRGKIWRINSQTGAVKEFLDFRRARNGALLTDHAEKGLRSFAFHPNFSRPGKPGYNKLYTLSTETIASRPSGVKIFGGNYPVKFHDVLAEWAVFSNDRTRVNPASRRELLRIAQHSNNHNTDQLLFDPNARPGQAAFGKLFFATGDGGSSGDPYDLAQNPGVMLGKVIRINPTYTTNGARYGVPADNPFVGRAGYLGHIWAMGVRHPQNMCIDTGGSHKFIFTDIGQSNIEEVNLMQKGANYGWPAREGTFVTDTATTSALYARGPNDASFGFTYPVAQYDHSDGRAITGGFVYRGTAIPSLVGHYLCGDIVRGRIFHVPVDELQQGSVATLRELTLVYNGQVKTLKDIVQGVGGRVDLRFGQGGNREIYILSKQDGVIRRLAAA